jgi:demethylmenaquinone methyltransferase/2-methoxy-6-polyprenyl-1,4-benzoquinol methylase
VKPNISKENIYQIFNQIASTYDRINKILSFGIDRFWRRSLCKQIQSDTPLNILDLATGTGDQALEILKRRPLVAITGVDKAQKMLELAQIKACNQGLANLHFVHADASKLPFENHVFDMITLSFGIRNFSHLDLATREMLRVLKPHGTLLILEFGSPKLNWLRALYFFYLRKILPALGGYLSRHHDAYKYLNESIEEFPSGQAFCNALKSHGFTKVSYIPLSFGIVNLYIGRK